MNSNIAQRSFPMSQVATEEITVNEAANQLGYALMTVYMKIQKGEIKVRRIGRYLRIRPEENQELFAQRAALRGQ
jgi:excisionase family DNA binding protein